jgi:hypothetical protein
MVPKSILSDNDQFSKPLLLNYTKDGEWTLSQNVMSAREAEFVTSLPAESRKII